MSEFEKLPKYLQDLIDEHIFKKDPANKKDLIIKKDYNTLSEIIEQLEKCKYECIGGKLENNIAFVKLKEMAQKT